ncbi:MAG: GrdX family protein [Oscillospiraceae bacterium]|nr:GrdX family protein [Oscillospiraceae bacterium]
MQDSKGATLITNNPKVKEKYADKYETLFIDESIETVFKKVRDHIHRGHKLLTHPLSGSVKPNENPYKTVLLTKALGKTDDDSVMIIEQCILTAQKFEKRVIHERHLPDLQIVDLSLISGALG